MRSVCATVALILMALLVSATVAADGGWPVSNQVAFTRNNGQWDEQVRFRATSGDAFIWFTDGGVRYSLMRSTEPDSRPEHGPRENLLAPPHDEVESLCFGVRFLGSNPRPDVMGLSEKEYCFNYFIGNDPTKWKTHVPSFDTVLYREIYPGIDMKYYASDNGVEYTFVLSPGADPSVIKLQYEGIEALSVGSDGELTVSTAWGNLTEKSPVVYQIADGREVEIAGSFKLVGGKSFGFALEDYDRESELIIDPVLTFSTYLGGSNSQYGRDIAVDQGGNLVIAGHTYSLDFPMVDAYQDTKAGAANTFDLFISKLNPVTGDLLYSTYFGGSDYEWCGAVELDNLDNIYVACKTQSNDLPTVNPYQDRLEGGFNDVYIFKLNSEGDNIEYATYLGGRQNEVITGLAVDNSGCAYVCGVTESDDFDIENAFQAYFAGGPQDGFVTKFSPYGNTLIYSTFLGGNEEPREYQQYDNVRGIAVNQNGEAYVVGDTPSLDFPTYDPLYACKINDEGWIDAFITKFSAAGNTVEFSTFFGGTEDEWIEEVSIGSDGNVYLFGSVESDDFPLLNAIQAERCPGGFLGGADLFVSVISEAGDALLYSTYLGGHDEDFAESMDLGPDNSIYVSGNTYSTDFPVLNYLDPTLGGAFDVMVACIVPNGSPPAYSTYLGGSGNDWHSSIRVLEDGSAAICGDTDSPDFPLKNPYQYTPPFNQTDLFVSLISGGCCTGMRGNFDGDPDNELDLTDILAAVSWTFEGGPAPYCLEEADTDGDGIVTIEDLVRLVNYIYDAGPAPVDCE